MLIVGAGDVIRVEVISFGDEEAVLMLNLFLYRLEQQLVLNNC